MERAFYRDLSTKREPHRLAERERVPRADPGPRMGDRPDAPAGPSLLALLQPMEDLGPLRAVLGLGPDGRPLLVDFSRGTSWHFFATGTHGAGKSSLLRTVMFSLALTARRSEVRFLGIEMGDQELVSMEALPHALADLAISAEDALGVLDWVAGEVHRRIGAGFLWPHIFLFIEALDRLVETLPARAGVCIDRILAQGAGAGVHVIASVARPDGLHHIAVDGSGIIWARAERRCAPGAFWLSNGFSNSGLQAAQLSARDLDRAVRLAQAGWRVSHAVPVEKGLSPERG